MIKHIAISVFMMLSIDVASQNYFWSHTATHGDVKYGYIYNRLAVVDSRNMAPSGWRVATNNDFVVLNDYLINNGYGYLGSGSDVGKSVASKYGWNYSSTAGDVGNDTLSNNSTGFTAVAAGWRSIATGFMFSGVYAGLWTQSTHINGFPQYCTVYYKSNTLNVGITSDSGTIDQVGMSVRIIKEDSNNPMSVVGNDGKVYPTVKIGNQVWCAVNSAETKYRNGNTIPYITGQSNWINATSGGRCAYNDDESLVY